MHLEMEKNRLEKEWRFYKRIFHIILLILAFLFISHYAWACNVLDMPKEMPNDGKYRKLGGIDGCEIDIYVLDDVWMKCQYKDAQVFCPEVDHE